MQAWLAIKLFVFLSLIPYVMNSQCMVTCISRAMSHSDSFLPFFSPLFFYPLLIYDFLIHDLLIYPLFLFPFLLNPLFFYPLLIYPLLIYPLFLFPLLSLFTYLSSSLLSLHSCVDGHVNVTYVKSLIWSSTRWDENINIFILRILSYLILSHRIWSDMNSKILHCHWLMMYKLQCGWYMRWWWNINNNEYIFNCITFLCMFKYSLDTRHCLNNMTCIRQHSNNRRTSRCQVTYTFCFDCDYFVAIWLVGFRSEFLH